MSTQDFTLAGYASLLRTIERSGYHVATAHSLRTGWPEKRTVLLRHDVDRYASRAIAMARLEADAGIHTSYYFRWSPLGGFPAQAIREISAAGHEIGYHYEDLARARGNAGRAVETFRAHLVQLRSIQQVTTVCAHGSPFSRHSNTDIWEHLSPTDFEVIDVARTIPHEKVVFMSDSGRTLAETTANLRDYVPDAMAAGIATLGDLKSSLRKHQYRHLHISLHPERWTEGRVAWSAQYIQDSCVVGIKSILRRLRP